MLQGVKQVTQSSCGKNYFFVRVVTISMWYSISIIFWLILWTQVGFNRATICQWITMDNFVIWTLLGLPLATVGFYNLVKRMQWCQRYKINNNQYSDRERTAIQKLYIKLFVGRTSVLLLYFLIKRTFHVFRHITTTTQCEHIPSRVEFVTQIIVAFVIADAFYYWSHRYNHQPNVYERDHKRHHEFVVCHELAIMHVQPIEMFGISLTLVWIPLLVLQMSFYAYAWYFTIAILHGYYEHCNFDLPFNPLQWLPFANTVRMHDAHHRLVAGNFGIYFDVWDRLCKTRIYII